MIKLDTSESLKDKFGVEHLDILTRDYAAMYIDGKIYFGKTHSYIINRYIKDKKVDIDLLSINHAMLHLIRKNDINYFFLETNKVLCNVDTEIILKRILRQYKKPFELYLYYYKDKLKRVQII